MALIVIKNQTEISKELEKTIQQKTTQTVAELKESIIEEDDIEYSKKNIEAIIYNAIKETVLTTIKDKEQIENEIEELQEEIEELQEEIKNSKDEIDQVKEGLITRFSI